MSDSPHPKHCICFYCEKHHPENAKYRDTLLGDVLRLGSTIKARFKDLWDAATKEDQ